MRRRILILSAAALVACGGEDTLDPRDRVIATGSYQYEGRWLHPLTMEWDTVRGQLVLDAATPDSIHGRWTLGGFRSDSTGGYWNENAYVMIATSNNGLRSLTHRLSRIGTPSQLTCTLSYREERNNQEPLITGGTCDVDAMP